MNFADLHPRRFFLETWREMDREAAEARAQREAEGRGFDYRPLIVFLGAAVLLTMMEYLGGNAFMDRVIGVPEDPAEAHRWLTSLEHERLGHAWWAGTRVLGYFVFPAIIVRLYGERIRDQGLSTVGIKEHLWLYGLCYLVVLCCVYGVSHDPHFTTYYPFYKKAHRSWVDFGAWELAYAAQFFALEFFFRGWMLLATKDQLGSHAIFVMVVPYVMIHFGKPMLETFGAVIAGVVLGTLSMKTRSIWSGFFVHVGVAISMDVAALLRTTGLPEVWQVP